MTGSFPADAPVIGESTYPVTMEAIVRYAGASGDFTPLHYDPASLASAGYEEFFAMGMLVAGKLGALIDECFPHDAIGRFRLRFHEPSWVGTEVVCTLLDHDARPDTDTNTVDAPGTPSSSTRVIGLLARDDRGRVIASGEATISPVNSSAT